MSQETAGQWYVLVQAATGVDGRWEIARTLHVEEGRAAAIARAAEFARTGFPDSAPFAERYGRTVFKTSETSWLVELAYAYWSEYANGPTTSSSHFRVTVGELVHAQEPPPVSRPEKGGRLRRALRRD